MRIVVTGIGMINAVGNDRETSFNNIISGKTGIDKISCFDASNYSVQIAGEVKDFDPTSVMDKKEVKKADRFIQLGLKAAKEAMEDAGIKHNEFDFKTENARKRFLAAVTSTFLNFQNKEHEELITALFTHTMSLETKQLILFWQFSLANRLFFEISRDVFVKNYFSGRVSFPKEDIVAYLKDLIAKTPELKDKLQRRPLAPLLQNT